MCQTIKKAAAGAIRNGFESNLNFTFGGKYQGFDVFNNNENAEKLQCPRCNPPLTLPNGELQFCADCRAEQDSTAAVLLANFKRHRRVWILDRECDLCCKPKTGAMMMRRQNVCRSCFAKMMQTIGAAQSRMISGAVNNQHKRLREAVSYVR